MSQGLKMTITSGSESSEILENIYPEVNPHFNKYLEESLKSVVKEVKKPHQCEFKDCNARFSRPWRLQAHNAVHLGKKPFPCDEENCNKSYTSNYHLRRHKITAHAIKQVPKKLVKCRHPECSQEFKTRQFEKKHFVRTHIEKTCKECGEQFFKRSQLKKHEISHTEDPFVCKECNVSFKHLYLLNRHKRGHNVHLCPVKTCMEAFKNWSNLRKHLKSHPCESLSIVSFSSSLGRTNTRVQNWHLNFFKTMQITVIFLQINQHTYKLDFVCEYCRKGYRNKHLLEAHINRHMNGTVRKQSQLKKYSCDICQTVVLGKASLRRHMSNIHGGSKVTTNASTSSKPRAPRKDKGVPKKSFASILSELQVPKEINTILIKHDVPEEEYLNVLFLENY